MKKKTNGNKMCIKLFIEITKRKKRLIFSVLSEFLRTTEMIKPFFFTM